MSKITSGFDWVNDIFQSLVVDRFNTARRRNSELASTACRALKFHGRSKIRQEPLRDLLASMGCSSMDPVLLPGPGADLGECGSQNAYHALGSIVRATHPRVIFETGTYLGVSALTMALNAPEYCHIHTQDLPEEANKREVAGLNKIDQAHVETSRYRVGEAFLRSPLKHRISQIREDSMSFRAETVMKDVDLAYIDGGHSYELIAKDTENAFRVMTTKGTIVWDDYFHLYPGVVKYLDELNEKLHLKGIEGTNYVIYSPLWK
jgi:predicted O-methyltransferase YrrM